MQIRHHTYPSFILITDSFIPYISTTYPSYRPYPYISLFFKKNTLKTHFLSLLLPLVPPPNLSISLFFLLIYLFPFTPPLDSLPHFCMAMHGHTILCKLFHQKSIPSNPNLRTNHTRLKQHDKLISLFVKPTAFNPWRHSLSYSSSYPL